MRSYRSLPAKRRARGVDHALPFVGGHRRHNNPCLLATGSIAQTVPPGIAQKVPPDLPLAVICFNEQTQTWAVGYLNLINKEGSATYISGDLAVTMTAKGVVQPPSDRPGGGDCFGKTLKELRAAGRVMEFKRN
jgi:hypothetical protein